MKKTKEISKLDIHWQVQRVFLKQVPFCDKLTLAEEYLRKNSNRADKERVLNYLEGLSFGYDKESDSREKCLQLYKKLEALEVSDFNKFSQDLATQDKGVLSLVLEDLLARCIRWLKKGYRQEELIEFIKKLAIYVGDDKAFAKLSKYVDESHQIKNTHKFFF